MAKVRSQSPPSAAMPGGEGVDGLSLRRRLVAPPIAERGVGLHFPRPPARLLPGLRLATADLRVSRRPPGAPASAARMRPALRAARRPARDGRAYLPLREERDGWPRGYTAMQRTASEVAGGSSGEPDLRGRKRGSGAHRAARAGTWRRLFGPALVLVGVAGAALGQPQHDRERLQAVARDDAEEVKAALAAGADPDARMRPGGRTALMEAADRGFANLIPILLAAGADIDARSADGWTALMQAAYEG